MGKPTMWFPTRSNTNCPVPSQKQAGSLKFGFKKTGYCTICVAKTKTLISFAVTVKLICVFVFEYADCCFSHEAALTYCGILRNVFLINMKLKPNQD